MRDCWSASKRNDNNGSEVKANYKSNNGLKPKMAGKVFAMSRSEVATSNDFIQGKCIIRNRLVDGLYDFEATHSFISFDCVKSLDLHVSSLPYEVVVSIPTNKPITTSSACLDYSVMVDGKTFSVNLICLPPSHLDVVLGMDWLSSNHILLNCKNKTLIFGACAQASLNLQVW